MRYTDWLQKNFDFDRDLALITGGTSGIGRAYVTLLAAQGCRCVVVSNEPALFQDLQAQLIAQGFPPAEFLFHDLSNSSEIIRLTETIEKLRIRVLVNNAGIGIKGIFTEIPAAKYLEALSVNALSPTLISHAVLPHMLAENRGLHICISSINVISPIAKNAVYTATKHYVWSYALAIAKEYCHTNLEFQIVLPGTTDTPFHIKQGVQPAAMIMKPQVVASRALNSLDTKIFMPNLIDRLFFPLLSLLPINLRMSISSFFMKTRLGVK